MNREDAEELTQDVFLKIYYNLNTYNSSKNFLAWALKLTKNLCIDFYRKRRKENNFKTGFSEFLFKIPSKENIEEKILNKEKYLKILELLNELPEEQAFMILLKDLFDFSYEDLQEIFNLPEGTIKSKLFRGRFDIALKMKEFFNIKDEKDEL